MGIKNNVRDLIKDNISSLGQGDNLVFLDIGAFDGEFSSSFAQDYKNATVYAIEACPVNVKCIKKISKKITNIVPCFNAISNENGYVQFNVVVHKKYKGKLTSQANSLYSDFVADKDWAVSTKQVSVSSFTLDSFCESRDIEHINFLKINCEGCEYKIFDSPTLEFLDNTDVIYIEMHTKCSRFLTRKFGKKRDKIERKLIESGFEKIFTSSSDITKKHIEQVWRKSEKN